MTKRLVAIHNHGLGWEAPRTYPWPQCRFCGMASGRDCPGAVCLACGSRTCHGYGPAARSATTASGRAGRARIRSAVQALPRAGSRKGAARGRRVRRPRQAAVRDTAPRRRLASLGRGGRGGLPRVPGNRPGDAARLRLKRAPATSADGALAFRCDRPAAPRTRCCYQSSSMHSSSEHSTMSMIRPRSCVRVRSSMA